MVLWLHNNLRDFTIHYADWVAPLHEFTKASTDWTDISSEQYLLAQVSFIKIKEIVSYLPRLNAIDYSLPVVLRVDASDIGAGAYLMNLREDGKEITILLWSHKCSDAATP